jgi:hypothetical protein
MMDDRPITGDERDLISDIHNGSSKSNGPGKAALLAGGLGAAVLGVATLMRLRGRRRKRKSLLSPGRWMRFLGRARRFR